jgi:tRNA pseudouridine55 synthase
LRRPPAFGFVNALKPPGPSSTAFGAWVRARFGASSAGHWGTLDPAACGVLPIALGKASRLLPYLGDASKSYAFELRVGAATDTADARGRVVRSSPVPAGWADGLEAAAASLVGALPQVPPMYSAAKVDGKPLYRSARDGLQVARRSRFVEIQSLRVLGVSSSSARLTVECSSGTYVRALCETLGDRLALPAHMGMLLRTRAGPFGLAGASTPEHIARDPWSALIDPIDVVPLRRVDVDPDAARRFCGGQSIDLPRDSWVDPSVERVDVREGAIVLVTSDGVLIGVGRASMRLEPVRVLVAAGENP